MPNANAITAKPPPLSGIITINLPPVDVQASQTDYVWCAVTIPYGFTLVAARWAAEAMVTAGTGVTFDIVTDDGTPQVLVADQLLTAITAGALAATVLCTIDDSGPVLPGTTIFARYTSDGSCTTRTLAISLDLRPTHYNDGR